MSYVEPKLLSRRRWLVVAPALGAAGAAILEACHHALSCNDLSSLSADEIATRTRVNYRERSTFADKRCANCLNFRPAGPDACGGCRVVRGPIDPAGYCTGWASRTSHPDAGAHA